MDITQQLEALRERRLAHVGPAISETLGIPLPLVLQQIEYLLDLLHRLKPQVIVREEKNRGSNYHGQSTNITCYLTQDEEVVPVNLAAETLSFAGAPSPFLMNYGGNLAKYLVVHQWDDTKKNDPQGTIVTIAGTKFDVVFNPFKVSDYLSHDRLNLSPTDIARYAALRIRLMELKVGDEIEVYADAPMDHRKEATAQGQQVYVTDRYVRFLLYVLETYGQPKFGE